MTHATTILAIETSCDETGVAVVRQQSDHIEVLAAEVASQIDVHSLTRGVVPEVAAREHIAVMRPLIRKVLAASNITGPGLTAIAVTVGPGLVPALAIGVQAARTLAFAWKKPIIPVHHIEGHIYSALLPQPSTTNYSLHTTNWPILALIVSGGHTMLINMPDHLQYEVVGTTRDDAAGEAFDKVARMLDLPYPGGPAIDELAKQGDPAAFSFTRPMLRSGDFNFSFSGIKTQVLYALRDMDSSAIKLQQANIAASFQQAVVETLVKKTAAAAEHHQPATIVLAGGVAANSELRRQLQAMADKHNLPLRIAPLDLCGDNAVMIGQAATFAYQHNRTTDWSNIDAQARIDLEEFTVTAAA